MDYTTSTLTTTSAGDAAALGALLGGYIATVGIISLAIAVLMIIAWWKIFEKAGEAGWKAIIPIYNIYTFCKIIGMNFWIYVLAIPFGLGILSALVPALAVLTSIYGLVLSILIAIKLGDAFKQSTGFKIGLFFLAPIFELILAFGSAKYAGKKA